VQESATQRSAWPVVGAVASIFLFLNVMPRMVGPSGNKWLTLSVPQPERFDASNTAAPNARLERGLPFTFWTTVGLEFTTKEGSKLFLPTQTQQTVMNRLSIGKLSMNLAIALGVVFCAAKVRRWTGSAPAKSKN
jgi:hypothetical protein